MDRSQRCVTRQFMADTATINATAAAIDSASNYLAQSNINKQTREYNDRLYARQRADALADWNMQNSYNSPAAQMQRFRDAGLNPNLIYGQSNEAGVVRTSSPGAWRPEAPRMDGARNSMEAYYNAQVREAQIDNLRATNDNLLAQNRLINAQTAGVYSQIEDRTSSIGYRDVLKGREQSLLPYSLEMRDIDVR